jgi:3-(3-hydroxy-phenyl)propionate hydroxylase
VVVLDGRPERDMIGSKAICQQRDVIDVWDAVGVGAEVARRGVTWTTARTFHRDREIFSFQFPSPRTPPPPPPPGAVPEAGSAGREAQPARGR